MRSPTGVFTVSPGRPGRDTTNGNDSIFTEEGGAGKAMTTPASWLRCYRCWSQKLEVQVHYEGALKVDADTGEARDAEEENLEAAVQCTDCLHDQPHLAFSLHEEEGRRAGRLEVIEDRWERLVLGMPWVASCTVTVGAEVRSPLSPRSRGRRRRVRGSRRTRERLRPAPL